MKVMEKNWAGDNKGEIELSKLIVDKLQACGYDSGRLEDLDSQAESTSSLLANLVDLLASKGIISFEELRDQKIIEMGEKILKDNIPTTDYKVKDENLPYFIKIVNELLEKEVDVVIPHIRLNDLLNYKDVHGIGVSITTSDLLVLDWLIIE